jgi:catechol 2,3-dioxygenase-like lactoylglutathione lyase family enzyme
MILEHIGLTVSDLDRSIDFYTRVLGFSILRKTANNAYLHLDDQLLELTQCQVEPGAQVPEGARVSEQDYHRAVGISHLGFRVENIDQAVEEIERSGGQLITPPYEFEPQIDYVVEPADEKLRRASRPFADKPWRIAVFADRDGILLELLER